MWWEDIIRKGLREIGISGEDIKRESLYTLKWKMGVCSWPRAASSCFELSVVVVLFGVTF